MNRIIKYRWWIIASAIIITAGVSTALNRIEIDPDLRNYFPSTMESMVNTDRIEEKFGNQDMVMMIFETDDIINKESLGRIKKVERRVQRLKGVRKTTSLFGSNKIFGEDGIMYVEPTVKRLPETAEDADALKASILSNDLVRNIVVSDDFRSAAIMITLSKQVDEDTLFAALYQVLEEIPGTEQVHFGGLPYLRQAINDDVRRDGLILVPIALFLMTLFLLVVFREWRGVALPFLVVVLASVLSLALIPLIGWKFYIITLLVPVMLIAVANDYGIHIIAKYQEINASEPELTMRQIAIQIAEKLWRPILLTGITTIAGISALLAHTMIPARQMALITGIGILFALFYSIIMLPAILSLLKRSKPVISSRMHGSASRKNPLNRLGRFIVKHHRVVPRYALVITVISAIGIFFLKVDSNEENFFPERHPVKQASAIINEHYGGSENLSVMFTGDMFDPEMLERQLVYKERLKQRDEIDLVMTFPDIVLEISKALNDPGTPLYDRIPPSREAVAQYMELYMMSGDPETLEQLVDFNYTASHMLIRINSVSNRDINSIIGEIRELTAEDQHVAAIGGYGYVRSQLATKVVQGQFYSLAIALVIIFAVMSIIFRSLKGGLIGTIPVAMSIVILFGVMGIFGVRLDVATALLSSLMIGIGVDYTIHFLWRYREELGAHQSPSAAVIKTLSTTGRGILFNALSVIVGFLVLMISSFTPIRYFGVLVVVSIFSCLTGALVVLPALVLSRRYSFLYPVEKVGSEESAVVVTQEEVEIEQPAIVATQEEVESERPAVATGQEEVASRESGVGRERPAVATGQEEVESEQPLVATGQEEVESEQPAVEEPYRKAM